jgi:putative ABC transport system permease protein
MSPMVFAWRSLTRQPARAVLGIAGVAIVGALLFDMLLLSRGLSVSFHELLDAVGYDVRVTATKAFPGMGPAIADATDAVTQIGGLPAVREAVPVRLGRALGYDARDEEVRIDLLGVGGPVRDTWSVIDGHDLFDVEPHGLPAIVINREVARRFDLEPGDIVRLRGLCREETRALPLVAFRVAGVADFLFDVARSEKAAMRLPDLDHACDLQDADEADFLLVGSEASAGSAEAVARIRAARPDLHVFSNEQFVERLRISNFSYFRQVSFALSTITLFFAFLLIATLLTVSVNQRLGEVAGLRAIGFSRRRVVLDLVAESLALVATGGLLSLPLGGLIAVWLDAILREMPGLPERLHFFVFQPRAIVLHALLLIGTGVIASLYPLYIVARLPIAGTLRREVVS